MTIGSLPPAPAFDSLLEAALYCDDIDSAEAFYGGVLGLEPVLRSGARHVFFRVGSTILLLFNPDETEVPSSNPALPVPTHGARGPGHLCFSASNAAIEAWRTRLEAAGYPVEADFNWPNGARSIYFRDPAGNSLEIAEPRLWG
ncbi:MAG: VOC family protein [Rhodobacteraceae bacterium]|nr:VOC family protein [Paracoccaceae bacterium]